MVVIHSIRASGLDFQRHAQFQQAAFREGWRTYGAARLQTPGYYEWKYLSPAGEAWIVQAFEQGEILATASAAPIPLGGEPINGAAPTVAWQVCDLATKHGARGRGLIVACIQQLVRDVGINQPIYCIPNPSSRSRLMAVGFRQTSTLRLHVSPVAALEKVRATDCSTSPSLDLWNEATLRWRFQSRPNFEYEILKIDGLSGRAIAVARDAPLPWPRAKILVVAGVSSAEALQTLGRAVAGSLRRAECQIVISLQCHDTSWHSVSVPQWALPRAFPVVSMNMTDTTAFGVAEWDVL